MVSVVYWPSTWPNMPFQRQRKWHIPMATHGKKSRRRAWLTIWDKVKSRSTVIDWCTGREWPVNCMTVISAWWRSNMPFQRLSGLWNYYITRWRIPLFTKACSVVAPCALSRPSSTYIEESKPHRRTILIFLLIAPTSHKRPSRK